MKRTLLAVAAVLALGSASAYAQTAGVQPSFKDYTDLTPTQVTRKQTADQHSAKSAQYASASVTRSDATVDDSGKASQPAPTLNDTFHYPTSN
jgi:hypothetical protein